MAKRTKLLYDQMPDPKYVISMGSCCQLRRAISTAPTRSARAWTRSFPSMFTFPAVPPRPEALTEGLLRIQDKIMREKWLVRSTPAPA